MAILVWQHTLPAHQLQCCILPGSLFCTGHTEQGLHVRRLMAAPAKHPQALAAPTFQQNMRDRIMITEGQQLLIIAMLNNLSDRLCSQTSDVCIAAAL